VIDLAGNIGIGTASPGNILHVVGDGMIMEDGSPSIELRDSDAGDSDFGLYAQADKLHITEVISGNGVGNERLTVQATGNVGIGTTSPTEELYVVGDIHATGNITCSGGSCSGGSTSPGGSDGQVQYNNSGAFGGATGLVYNDTNSRVGIGTATPSVPLEVSGSILSSGAFPVTIDPATGTISAAEGQAIRFRTGGSIVLETNGAGKFGMDSNWRMVTGGFIPLAGYNFLLLNQDPSDIGLAIVRWPGQTADIFRVADEFARPIFSVAGDGTTKLGDATFFPDTELEVYGDIILGNGAAPQYRVSNVADPINDDDVATKGWVVAQGGGGGGQLHCDIAHR